MSFSLNNPGNKHPAYYTYIVRCADNSLYTGITDNLELRLREHNGQLKGGAKYTRAKRPVYYVHFEEYSTRKEAAAREREIKKMDKAEKEVLILRYNKPDNPL